MMAKQNWRIKFREVWPDAIERRVPTGETPEEIVYEIDKSLKYKGKFWNSIGNHFF